MGVEKQVLRAGTGPKVVRGQNVTVHCTGFESSLMDFYKMLPRIDFTLLPRIRMMTIEVLWLNIFLLGSGTFGRGKNRDLSQKFWSTKDPGQTPFTFKIGQGSVIKGWDEGVLDMQIGEVARLQCSPDYAYGTSGFPAWGIQPNSVLVFEIEVLGSQ